MLRLWGDFFKKKMSFFFTNIVFFVNIGPYGSENFKMLFLLQTAAKSFQKTKLFLNFLQTDPHRTTLRIFEILKIEILTNFIRFH